MGGIDYPMQSGQAFFGFLKCSYLEGIHQLSWDKKVKHKNGGALHPGFKP
jgi:hypothetical protein